MKWAKVSEAYNLSKWFGNYHVSKLWTFASGKHNDKSLKLPYHTDTDRKLRSMNG